MNSIILLTANLPLCKQFSADGANIIASKPQHPKSYGFRHSQSVADINALSGLLSALELEHHSAIVRGAIAEDVDAGVSIRRRLRRGYTADPNDYPIIDVPVSWIMVDIDKLLLPATTKLLSDPLQAIEYAITQLPSEFQDVSYHWQLSASAGVFGTETLSAHLYFWLDKALSNEELRRWARWLNNKRLVDPAVFNAAQLHYTAAPIFTAGAVDPFPQNRSGLVLKAVAQVSMKLPAADAVTARQLDAAAPNANLSIVRGFSNILETLGDHDGGDGFYNPLLRATASYVAKAGGEAAQKTKQQLIQHLQSAIDDADQSSHSMAEIDRYRSQPFLEQLIDGAIDKFGNKETIPAYFETHRVGLAEGEKAVTAALTGFAQKVKQYYADHDMILLSDTPMLAIKATAGLGKTSKVIKQLISDSALRSGDVHYFVPNHRLSKELVADLEAELNFTLPAHVAAALGSEAGNPVEYSRVRVIAGRGQLDDTGRTMCWKNDLAAHVAQSGQSVSKLLCKNGTAKCEYYEQCGYQAQFEEEGIEVPEHDSNSDLLWEVTVMTHSHMFLNTKDRLHEPKLIIVDEAFYQQGIETIKISPTEVFQADLPICLLVHKAMLNGEKQLLAHLRILGITSAALDSEAEQLEVAESAGIALVPSMPHGKQQQLVRAAEPKKNAALLLRQLATELRLTDRAASHSVYFDGKADKIIVTRRKEFTIPGDIPTLFIDADHQSALLSQFRDGVETVEIAVERHCTVHQFTDLTFSKTALLTNGQDSELLLQQVKEFVQSVGQHGQTLLVCSKAVRCAITSEPDTKTPQDCEWHGVTVTHFGAIRGLNHYENYSNVIILGREQPAAVVCEEQARALWWDAEPPLELLETKAGHKPLEQQTRGYRTAEGSSEGVRVQVHPDDRVQLVLEQIREAESVQAIDRLRLLRPNTAAGDRQVFILSSVPLDITVHHLWRWERLQRALGLWREAEGVLPLDPIQLLSKCPSLGSDRTARRATKDIESAMPLIRLLIRDVAKTFVKYRRIGHKKTFTALIDTSAKPADLVKVLSGLAGGPVEVLGAQD